MARRHDRKLGKVKAVMLFLWLYMIVPFSPLWGEEAYVGKIENPVQESIETRQKSQKELDKWEEERLQLQAKFETLLKENDTLKKRVATLEKQEASQLALNQTLTEREQNSRKIAEEMGPFLENVYAKTVDFVSTDVPFLKDEREKRMGRLKNVMDDMEISAGEKYRKIMEALFVEAEYGNTIEVYQDKITLEGEELLGDIFRLGRISLFFLTLDSGTAAYYNVSEKKWSVLDDSYTDAIYAAIEMGSKRRPIDILCLPLGKLAVK